MNTGNLVTQEEKSGELKSLIDMNQYMVFKFIELHEKIKEKLFKIKSSSPEICETIDKIQEDCLISVLINTIATERELEQDMERTLKFLNSLV